LFSIEKKDIMPYDRKELLFVKKLFENTNRAMRRSREGASEQ
jgi:hypothetical protein